MNIPFISDIIAGLGKAIDPLVTSDEERIKAQALLAQAQTELEKATLEYHAKSEESRASVIRSEAESESWMAANWRPFLMMSFTAIIISNFILFPIIRMFGVSVVDLPLPSELWTLLTIGVNGYIITRSAEKMLPDITKILKK